MQSQFWGGGKIENQGWSQFLHKLFMEGSKQPFENILTDSDSVYVQKSHWVTKKKINVKS